MERICWLCTMSFLARALGACMQAFQALLEEPGSNPQAVQQHKRLQPMGPAAASASKRRPDPVGISNGTLPAPRVADAHANKRARTQPSAADAPGRAAALPKQDTGLAKPAAVIDLTSDLETSPPGKTIMRQQPNGRSRDPAQGLAAASNGHAESSDEEGLLRPSTPPPDVILFESSSEEGEAGEVPAQDDEVYGDMELCFIPLEEDAAAAESKALPLSGMPKTPETSKPASPAVPNQAFFEPDLPEQTLPPGLSEPVVEAAAPDQAAVPAAHQQSAAEQTSLHAEAGVREASPQVDMELDDGTEGSTWHQGLMRVCRTPACGPC